MGTEKKPDDNFETSINEIESVILLAIPEQRNKWPAYFEILKDMSEKLEHAETKYGLFSTDSLSRWAKIRKNAFNAMNVLIIPEFQTKQDEENEIKSGEAERKILFMLHYRYMLKEWKEELLDRIYDKAGKNR